MFNFERKLRFSRENPGFSRCRENPGFLERKPGFSLSIQIVERIRPEKRSNAANYSTSMKLGMIVY